MATKKRISRNFVGAGKFTRDEMREALSASQQAIALYGGDLYESVVKKTPIDTGKARGGWAMLLKGQRGNRNPKVSDAKRVGQPLTSRERSHKAQRQREYVFKGGGNLRIQNIVEYISLLEGGSSRQAPHGMLVRTLGEFENSERKYNVKLRSGRLSVTVKG